MKTIIPFALIALSINLAGCGSSGDNSTLFKDGVAGAAGDMTLPGTAGAGSELTPQDAPMCSASTTCVDHLRRPAGPHRRGRPQG